MIKGAIVQRLRLQVKNLGKRIYWILLIGVSLIGLTTMIYFGIQPRPIPKIKISKFESHNILANSILLRLRQELMASQVVLLGYEPGQAYQAEVWQHFLNNIQEPSLKFDQVIVEKSLESQLFQNSTLMDFKDEFPAVLKQIESGIQAQRRFALVAPISYTAQAIPGNLAYYLNANLPKKVTSLSIVGFPRSRQDEGDTSYPCIVEGVDQSGLGPFGCLLIQSARSQYLKKFLPGDFIGFVNQIGMFDYIVFYTQEK